MKRTPEVFVSEMLGKGCKWWEILSTTRVIRGGSWYEPVKALLVSMKLMPTVPEEIAAVRDQIRDNYKQFVKENLS